MNPGDSTLLTDLYQLTMLQGYWQHQMHETAVFEFFVRKLPTHRNFLLAAGLEQVILYLEELAFSPADIEWLAATQRFQCGFVRWLEKLHFSGDVDAMPEGTVFFADEPILRVTAPLPQAQLVETRIINLLNFQTVVASKAARAVLVAREKVLVDFGLRRTHGAEAGLLAARASYIAGFSGTSTVLACQRFDIPIYGTMAHSFVQAHDDESAAFTRFADANPGNVVLLIDTYQTEARSGESRAPRSEAKAAWNRMQEYAGAPVASVPRGKTTWPGCKQVYRALDDTGYMTSDVLTLHDDRQKGEPLLIPILRNGKRMDPPRALSALRERAANQLVRLPNKLRTLRREGNQVAQRLVREVFQVIPRKWLTAGSPGLVTIKSQIGARRILDLLSGEQLPRIW